MPITIIQWNIHGIFNNYNELTLLIKDLAPAIVFLQETHLPYKTLSAPKNILTIFIIYHRTPWPSKVSVCLLKETSHICTKT